MMLELDEPAKLVKVALTTIGTVVLSKVLTLKEAVLLTKVWTLLPLLVGLLTLMVEFVKLLVLT